MLCYLFGITEVSLLSFVIGAVGMAIPNCFWCYAGSLLHSITELGGGELEEGQIRKLIFMSIGFLLALVGLYMVQ